MVSKRHGSRQSGVVMWAGLMPTGQDIYIWAFDHSSFKCPKSGNLLKKVLCKVFSACLAFIKSTLYEYFLTPIPVILSTY